MMSQVVFGLSRAIREPAVHTTAALASLPAAEKGLQAMGISSTLDPIALANGLFEPQLWITLGIAALFGGLGGITAELLSLHGNIELPHRVKRGSTVKRSRLADPRYEVDLGIISRLLLGAAAALALLSIYAPTSATALIANALIAGSAATGVFRLAQGRLLAGGQAPEKPTSTRAPKTQLSVVGGTHAAAAQ